MQPSKIHSHLMGSAVRPIPRDTVDAAEYAALAAIGIHLNPAHVNVMNRALSAGTGMDDLIGLTTSASIPTPVQFLQAWLPGFVHVATAARKIDELIGITTVGSWEDEEIIQGVMELTGKALPYNDYNNIPLSSWNAVYERRTVVRFEEGLRVGTLEELRAGKGRVNSAATKRAAAQLALDIQRNRVGFLGYNGGSNRTYGFLNDPGLSAYVAAGTAWSAATFAQITANIRSMAAALRSASGDTVNAADDVTTLAVATISAEYLAVTTDFGISVADWIKKTYPKMRVVSAPELNAANGGANVAYLYAERAGPDDGSDDGGATWGQLVPSKFQTIGVEKQAKAYVEDYSNATAGVMLKRPWAVTRLTGI